MNFVPVLARRQRQRGGGRERERDEREREEERERVSQSLEGLAKEPQVIECRSSSKR